MAITGDGNYFVAMIYAGKITGIIAARMDSKRFPGKMVQHLCGQPLIQFVINRAKLVNSLSSLVVATTDRPVDDIIVEMTKQCGIDVYRGSTNDVASRFLKCVSNYGSDYFIRLNGDSPCIDVELVEQGISLCPQGYDIITNIPSRTFPYGISLEIVKAETFTRCYTMMTESDREHVTSYFYRNKGRFSLKEIINSGPERTDFRFTIDLPQDLERLNKLLKDDPYRSWRDVR